MRECEQLSVACINSPASVTISGDTSAIETLSSKLDEAGTFWRILRTNGKAYHSQHCQEIGKQYEKMLHDVVKLTPPSTTRSITIISTVTGENLTASMPPGVNY
jgi:acyl transferase domain-containing protein